MSLRFWLPLTKDLKNQGLSSVTPTQTSGFTKITAGKLGGCYKFTDVFDTLLPLSEWDWTTQSVSFGCWAKISKTELSTLAEVPSYSSTYTTMGGTLLGRDSYGGIAIRWQTNNIYTDGVLNKLYVYTHIRNTNSQTNQTGSQEVPFDTWFHIMTVIDRNDSQIKLYLNGELAKSIALTVTGTFATGTFRIAEATWHGGSGNISSGCWQLNDVRVYNHALSPLEVKHIAQGLILHYPLNRNGWGQENLIANSNVEKSGKGGLILYDLTTTGINTVLGKTMRISADIKSDMINSILDCYVRSSSSQSMCSNTIFTNIGTDYKRYSMTTICNTNQSLTPQWFAFRSNGSNGTTSTATFTIKNVKLEIGENTTPWSPASSDVLATTMGLNDNVEYDCSGFENNGTRIGTFSWISDTPKYNVSINILNGSYIDTGYKENIGTGDFTVSVWIKMPQTSGKSYQPIFSNKTTGAASVGFAIYFNQNQNKLLWSTADGSAATEIWMANTINIYDKWMHIVMVRNASDAKKGYFYINGERYELASVPVIRNITNETYNIQIGDIATHNNSAYRYVGLMSDFRIYATALSAEDVKDLYNLGATIDTNGVLSTYEFAEQ